MADISDVMTGLVNLVSAAVYPNGTANPSVAGVPVMCYPGWPIPNQLNTDIAAGKAHVSVYPRPEERNTTRYPLNWQTVAVETATLTLFVSGSTVTVGGTVSAPQACMVHLNGTAYSYQVQAGDTLNSIAAGIAALVAGASAVGAVVTFPGVIRLTSQVITSGSSIREVRRQERLIQTAIWAPTPSARDSIAKAIDPVLASTFRFTLPDQTSARLIYRGSPMTDMLGKAKIYRRDLLFTVEYATTQTATDYTVGDFKTNITLSST